MQAHFAADVGRHTPERCRRDQRHHANGEESPVEFGQPDHGDMIKVISLVICIERAAPAANNSRTNSNFGVARVMKPQASIDNATSKPLKQLTLRNPKLFKIWVVTGLMPRLPAK